MAFNLKFSPEKKMQTTFGVRMVSHAVPTSDFWVAWKQSKTSLGELGLSVRREGKGWLVTYMREPSAMEGTPPPVESVGYILRMTRGLLKPQVPHTANLCAAIWKFGSTLDASETGTGKTYTAFGVARELQLTPAIVCPKSVIPAWKKVAALFNIRPYFIANYESCKSKKFPHGLFDRAESAYRWNLGNGKILLVVDEAHKCKGEYTQNAKMLIAAKYQKIPTLILTATTGEQPADLRAIGYHMGIHSLSDFREWVQGMGGYIDEHGNWACINPIEAMRQVHNHIFPGRGSRMKLSDLGDDFPKCAITADVYPIKDFDKQNAAYEKLLTEVAKLEAQKSAGWAAAAKLTLNLRYRQMAELCKVDLLADLAQDFRENKKAVAIFVNFIETLEALHGKLRGSVLIHGGQTGDERERAIEAFQADKAPYIISTIQAGGAGISLHDLHGNYSRVGLVCPTYSARDLKQVLGRLPRAGSKTESLYRLIYAAGTIEEKVCQSAAAKLAAISSLNDGDLMEPDLLGVLGQVA